MEKALKLAMSNGYKPDKINERFEWDDTGVTHHYDVDMNACLLDPIFWRTYCKSINSKDWKVIWHKFIDHIASGKKKNTFFIK